MSIEEQIDNAIRDCAVSPDAMRWSPEPLEEYGRVMIAPIGTSPEDGDWIDIGHLTHDGLSDGYSDVTGPLAPDEVELLASLLRDHPAAALLTRAEPVRPRWWHRITRRSAR